MEFPDSIRIDTRGNIDVGEVDSGKRIQKFAPVLTDARWVRMRCVSGHAAVSASQTQATSFAGTSH